MEQACLSAICRQERRPYKTSGGGDCLWLDLGCLGFLDNPVADADKLKDGTRASIAQPRFGESDDTRVTAGTANKPGRDFLEADTRRLLIAQKRKHAAASVDYRRVGLSPFGIVAACAPVAVRLAVAINPAAVTNGGAVWLCRLGVFQRADGYRDAVFDKRANFFGLLQRGDDAAVDFGLVIVILSVAFRQE
jgi:hypothetical protein